MNKNEVKIKKCPKIGCYYTSQYGFMCKMHFDYYTRVGQKIKPILFHQIKPACGISIYDYLFLFLALMLVSCKSHIQYVDTEPRPYCIKVTTHLDAGKRGWVECTEPD